MCARKIWRKRLLAISISGSLGFSMTNAWPAQIAAYRPYAFTGSNWAMYDSTGSLIGGTNDVGGSWNGTVFTSQADIPADLTTSSANMSLGSPTSFLGSSWTAHNVQVFASGTYTFTEDANSSTAAFDPGGPSQSMVVGSGQLGIHLLWDWNGNYNIGVVDVWNVNAPYTGAFYSGPATTSDSWSANNNHVWGLATTDSNGDGVAGQPMVNGPFAVSGNAETVFNLYNGTNVAAVPLPATGWLMTSGVAMLLGLRRRKPVANG